MGQTTGRMPGNAVDHIVLLKRGGADSTENNATAEDREGQGQNRMMRLVVDHSVDPTLSGSLETLATKAWGKQCHDPRGSFLLSPLVLAPDYSPQGLWQTLRQIYEHARTWAPGLDVPSFVPPVRIADLESHAGHFLVDEESYASIAVSTEFLGSIDATLLILAHEACHHILLQSGISYQYKNDLVLNERVTDLAMFVCGFGEIVRRGHSVVRRCSGQFVSTHLGYLSSDEYEMAYRLVLAKRVAEHLPGVPERPSLLTYFRHRFGRIARPSGRSAPRSNLLEDVIKETESRSAAKVRCVR